MGFSYRQSVSVGPFRFNLSGAGVGMSVGIPGFRVGTGPRGNYVRLGARGVSYRCTLPAAAPPPSLPRPSSGGVVMQDIESTSAARIVDSSSETLLNEIREKRRMLALKPFAIVLTCIAVPFAIANGWGIAALVVGIVAILAAGHRDRVRKTVVILYDFEAHAAEMFRRFGEWAEALASSRGAWHVASEGRVHDRKYHAGASTLVNRSATTIRTAEPPGIRTNVPVLSMGVGRQTLYFLPDRLLVFDRAGVGAISYATLDIAVNRQRFIEGSRVPPDATVVDHTWRYVNKSGGPDRRFNHNPQLPICLYDEISLRTASGLNEVVQISRSGIGEGFAAAVRGLA